MLPLNQQSSALYGGKICRHGHFTWIHLLEKEIKQQNSVAPIFAPPFYILNNSPKN